MSHAPGERVEARTRRLAELVASLVARLEPLQLEFNLAQWDASVEASPATSERRADLDRRIRSLLSDPDAFAIVRAERDAGPSGDPLLDRQLEVLERLLAAHQMPADVIQKLVEIETALDSEFNNFRAELNGRRLTDNELREVLRTSDDASLRRAAWEASKQVGERVEARLLELVRLRNRAARDLGYRDFYAMTLMLDELDEGELLALLDRVEAGTRERFEAYRRELDARLAGRFGIAPEQVRPWHFVDPFFQEAPVARLDLDRYFTGRDLVATADRFFTAVGLPLGDLLERADLFEKPGKSQHAFCLSVDRGDDVRVLCNLQGNELWMSVLLHELGHAVYDRAIDRSLPWLLRAPAHTLVTEASAMLFGRVSRNAGWLARHAGVPGPEAARTAPELECARRDQLLVLTRWCLTMSAMERALYRDPEQDLSTLWWDLVERYQRVRRPEGRHAPDWASKIHFSVAPVYYHNYLLGEMLASQIERAVTGPGDSGGEAWQRALERPETGRFLSERLYRFGKRREWREAVRHATGQPLSADAFVAEVCAAD